MAAVAPAVTKAQVVPSQANTDAAAQRRLQETAREAQRQQRIDQQLRKLSAALSPVSLAGSSGPVRTRQAMAALSYLQAEGMAPDEALAQAARLAGPESASSQPSAYLRSLFAEISRKITPSILAKLEAGEDPAPAIALPPYQP